MSRTYLSTAIGMLLACVVATAAAPAAGQPVDYKLEAEHTSTSPDA
jgi:hypothetical protein